MNTQAIKRAAAFVWKHWSGGTCFESLPRELSPQTITDGYRIQAAIGDLAGDEMVGWKIAATSEAGQRHIHVDGPIAGRLLGSRVYRSPARFAMGANRMRVAEAEFAFTLADDLPPRETPYTLTEVMGAVATLHPAIELPDSRFEDFTVAGSPALAADVACAHWFVLGEATRADWRSVDLRTHATRLEINGETVTTGRGADALGDPRAALTWLANAHAERGEGLLAGQVITTGVCGKPSPIDDGDRIVADFGLFGQVEVHLIG